MNLATSDEESIANFDLKQKYITIWYNIVYSNIKHCE